MVSGTHNTAQGQKGFIPATPQAWKTMTRPGLLFLLSLFLGEKIGEHGKNLADQAENAARAVVRRP